jgi:hypothetical protein
MKYSLEQPCLQCGGPTKRTLHTKDCNPIWNKRHCAQTLCNFCWYAYTRNGCITYPSELKPVAGNWRTSPEGTLLIIKDTPI